MQILKTEYKKKKQNSIRQLNHMSLLEINFHFVHQKQLKSKNVKEFQPNEKVDFRFYLIKSLFKIRIQELT